MNRAFTDKRLLANHTPLPGNGPAGVQPGYAPRCSGAELARQLQTTLDLETILELFSHAIQWAVPHDGLGYEHPGRGLQLTQGRLSRHSCSYNLVVEQQPLGSLRLMRGRRFREEELRELETLLAALVYPLRNALLYREAVNAAQTDPLTGLQNRTALERLLPGELAALRRGQQRLALLVVDLDHFKSINDTHGHSAGDRALQAAARCLGNATRESDMLFRFGGEEFVTLLRGAGLREARQAGERIRTILRDCPGIRSVAPGLTLTASIGAAAALPTDTPAELFDRADRAMYKAKQAGRDRVMVSETG
jgi:diguanylate cyclase (GGDEF)-like protein